MARIARVVIAGVAHHVTQRGNNAQDIFFVDDDRGAYLELLRRQCEKYGLELLGYCLMTNHVHLVAKPFKEHSLAKAVGK
jgi:putative transposase